MTLEEMQELCKKAKVTSQDEVWAVSPIYCLLNFHKEDFCKLVDAIGLEKWVEAANRWKRLDMAEQMLTQKESYERNKARLYDINQERERLAEQVEQYEKQNGIQHAI